MKQILPVFKSKDTFIKFVWNLRKFLSVEFKKKEEKNCKLIIWPSPVCWFKKCITRFCLFAKLRKNGIL